MRQSPVLPAILASLIGLASCHDDPAGSSFGNSGPEALRFCQQFIDTLSRRFPTCQGGRPEGWHRLYTFLNPRLCDEVAARVTAGSTRFDGTQAGACLRLFEAAGCDTLVPEVAPCARIFQGTLSGGAACQSDDECVDGSCTRMSGACGGQCADLPGLGEPCPERRCAQDARCTDGKCMAHVLSNSGGPCLASDDCQQGVLEPRFTCVGGSITSRTCQARKTEGACTNSFDCRSKYFCDPMLRECRPRLALGAGPCSATVEGQCEATTLCLVPAGKTTGTCVEQLAAEGSPCAMRPNTFGQCTGWCEADGAGGGVCRPPKPTGASCLTDLECEGRRCDATAHTCLAACAR